MRYYRSESNESYGERSRRRHRSPRKDDRVVRVKREKSYDRQEGVKTEPIYLQRHDRVKLERQSGIKTTVTSDLNPVGASDSGNDPVIEPEKPNFEPSGLLAFESNQRNGVALKYTVPPESRAPILAWMLFVFKPEGAGEDAKAIKTVHIYPKEHYIIGKDQRVADIEAFHPTIDGDMVVPYIIDLESTNGTYLNNERIEPSRYYELRDKDVLKFGLSTREYVVMNDGLIKR